MTGISVQDLADRLELVGHYRLKSYWYLFLTPVAGSSKRKLPFLPRTTWDPIWERYVFDQELRNLIFDGIVSIAVFLEVKSTGPSVGYIRPANLYGFSIEELKGEIVGIAKNYKRSSLPQRKLFDSTYCDSVPPIWMLVNCLSYGNFKKIFFGGPDSAIKHKLASHMGIMSKKPSVSNEKLLRCWLENIRVARNKTATMTAFGAA